MTDVLTVGPVTLDIPSATLRAPKGSLRITRSQRAVLAKLMGKPGAFIAMEHLIMALYPDPDREADYAAGVVRIMIQQLRRHLMAVAGPDAPICIEVSFGMGYRIHASRPDRTRRISGILAQAGDAAP